MMDIHDVTTDKEKAKFVDFAYEVYRDVPAYRDNLGYTCKNFIYQKDSFSRACRTKPILIYENGTVVARCAYIAHSGLDAAQIALFEALPDKREAVDIIIDAGKIFAAENGLERLLIGINGHSSYGVGFLCDNFDAPNPFDGVYSKSCYPEYFRNRDFKEHRISTYYIKPALFDVGEDVLQRINERFTFRKANLRNLRAEAEIFGALFNETLKGTPFFFPRPISEWYEVFKELQPILKNENMIYVLKKGKEVGFLFWHPNYNMLLHGNKKNRTASFFLKYIFGGKRITEMKVNAIGIMPEYLKSGAVIGLFHELYSAVQGRYDGGETGFVFDDNISSSLICQRFGGAAYRRYILFETTAVQGGAI